MDKRFIGSTIALIIGWLSIIGGLGGTFSLLPLGMSILLSTYAYRSAKKRRFEMVKSTTIRKSVEIVGIISMILLVILQNDYVESLNSDPFTNLAIPLWGVIAYIISLIQIHDKTNMGQDTRKAFEDPNEDGAVEYDPDLILWKCDFCHKNFDSKAKCGNHEQKCKLKLSKIVETSVTESTLDIEVENKVNKDIKYCVYCGTKLRIIANYCQSCGKKINTLSAGDA